METNYPLTAKINEAYVLLNRHSVYFYVKKGITIAFEILFYLMALALLIGPYIIPGELEMGQQDLNSDVKVKEVWEIRQYTEILFGLKVVCACIALFFILIGLVFGYIRRKDNRIRKAALLLEQVLNQR